MPELHCRVLKYMKEFRITWPRLERATYRQAPEGFNVRVVDKELLNSKTTLRVEFALPTQPLLVEKDGIAPDLFMLKIQMALEVAVQCVYEGKEIWVVEKDRNTIPIKRAASSLILED